MELDLNMSDMLVELIITKRCSTQSRGASIEGGRGPSTIARVEMLRHDEKTSVTSGYQDPIFGNSTLLRLERKGA